MKRCVLFWLSISLILLFAQPVLADDVSVFGTGKVNVKPNILFIIDNTDSMANRFSGDYEPGVDWTRDIASWNSRHPDDKLKVFKRDVVYRWDGFDGVKEWAGSNVSEWSEFAALRNDPEPMILNEDGIVVPGFADFPSVPSGMEPLACESAQEDLVTKGKVLACVDSTQAGTANAPCSENIHPLYIPSLRYLATGNYISYRLLKWQTKIEITKTIIKDIIETNVDDSDVGRMNIAIMTLNNKVGYDPNENYNDPRPQAAESHLSTDWLPNSQLYYYEDLDFLEVFPSDFGRSIHGNYCHEIKSDLLAKGRSDRRMRFRDSASDGYFFKKGDCYGDSKYLLGSTNYWMTENYGRYEQHYQLKVKESLDDDGGHVVAGFGMKKADLLASLEGIGTNGGNNKALAETLAEAGLYLSGISEAPRKSWANPDCWYPEPGSYISARKAVRKDYAGNEFNQPRPSPAKQAMQWRCQKNFVILVTDSRMGLLETSDGLYGGDYKDFIQDTAYTFDGDHYGWNIFKDSDHGAGYYATNFSDHEHKVKWNERDGVLPPAFGNNTEKNIGVNRSLLDEVAAYLYNQDDNAGWDLISGGKDAAKKSFDDPRFKIQRSRLYVLGLDSFLTSAETDFMKDAAYAGHGRYYAVQNGQQMRRVFNDILQDIFDKCSSFAATSVSVSNGDSLYSGDTLYLPMFQPGFGRFTGNLKKYAVDDEGNILDRYGNPAVVSGQLAKTAADLWDSTTAGVSEFNRTNTGGVGELLITHNAKRKFYTSTGEYEAVVAIDPLQTNDDGSEFGGDAKFSLTELMLDDPKVVSGTDVLRALTGDGVKNNAGWILGDIMHSSPAVKNYTIDFSSGTDVDEDRSEGNVIFVGANDGFLHCFFDEGSSVKELWSFLPRDLAPKIRLTYNAAWDDDVADATNHPYFVDGSPVLYDWTDTNGATKTFLVCGERRGGRAYTILNVTNPTEPAGGLSVSDSALGQSWGTPLVDYFGDELTIFLPGGYDPNQDIPVNIVGEGKRSAVDGQGKGVLLVNAVNAGNKRFLSHVEMNHCIVDLAAFDRNFDQPTGKTSHGHNIDTIYAPDLGGNIFAFKDKTNDDGTREWKKEKVFSASKITGRDYSAQKFFHAPDIVMEQSYDYVFIGSGDRAHPELIDADGDGEKNTEGNIGCDIDDQCRFYGIKHRWDSVMITSSNMHPDSGVDISDPNVLWDVTNGSYPTVNQTINDSPKGWYIRLEAPGEKVVSRPITLNKVVYFTTYQPTSLDCPDGTCDKCRENDERGIGRLYALNYKNGGWKYGEFAADPDSDPIKEGDDETVYSGDKDRRSLVLGKGMPPQPSIMVKKNGIKLVVGSFSKTLDISPDAIRYYWKLNDSGNTPAQ